MKSTTVLIAFAASAFALPAAAQTDMSAFYVGATIGQSEFKDACSGAPAGVSCDDKDTAWRAFAGYQATRYLGIEFGYHNLGEATASAGGVSAKAEVKAWELLGVGTFPVTNQFGIYGKLGGYRATTDVSSNVGGSSEDTNTGWTWGVGAQFDPMPSLGVRLEWQQYRNVGSSGSDTDVNVLSLGALWRFR
jgi:OmpA-OmpF porin, OOP family